MKLNLARKTKDPYRMARKLLPEFYSLNELKTCSCVPLRPGKESCPQVDKIRLKLLLGKYNKFQLLTLYVFTSIGEVRKRFPGGWTEEDLLKKPNQAFIDYRNKVK